MRLFSIFLAFASVTYYRVTADELNLLTGVLFLLTLSSLLFILAEAAIGFFTPSTSTTTNTRLLLTSLTVALIFMELLLRFGLAKYSNYQEQNGNTNYISIYRNNNPSWFHLHEADSNIVAPRKEFVHRRNTNSLGLSEKEIPRAKEPAEYRIIALGDSFTEGQGTSYNSTWIKIAEKDLAAHVPTRTITAINAGIMGSDVYFEYILLKERLLSFKPDLVIVAVNHSDVDDIIIRGGMERFSPDGRLTARRKGPPWEWIYGISYIFRHITHDVFGYSWLLLGPAEVTSEERDAVEQIRRCIGEFSKLATQHNFKILVVFHPHETEIKDERYYPLSFNDLIADLKYSSRGYILDLLEYYRTTKIITRDNRSQFFWPLDLHHNTKGYEVMGHAIANKVLEWQFLKRE